MTFGFGRRAIAFVALGLVAVFAVGRYFDLHKIDPTRTVVVLDRQLGRVEVDAPTGEPRAFIVLLSGAEGTNAELRKLSALLVSTGAAVMRLSTPDLLRVIEAKTSTGCHYTLGRIEDLSQRAQKALGASSYRWPVMVGLGEGGLVAYLSLKQAPVNTAAGAVSVDFDPVLRTRLPFCGNPPAQSVDGAFVYLPPASLNGRWIVVSRSAGEAARKAFTETTSVAEVRQIIGDNDAGLVSIAKAATEIADTSQGSIGEELPIEEMPAPGSDTLVVFYSGDGGWRDIDKRISEYLSRRGISVLGVDSLRYFWREKAPAEIASDLERLLSDYRKRWGITKVALVGYSMGAGVLPFVWANLSDETKRSTGLIAMLSLDPKASFEISISGFIGLARENDMSIGPAVSKLPHEKVVCFYGSDDSDSSQSGCLSREMQGATLVERPGGHHFDGNYEPIAQIILNRLNPGYTNH